MNSRLVRALQNEGLGVKPCTMDTLSMPDWMLEQEGVSWENLTISSMNGKYLQPVPGRHMLLTMVESDKVAPDIIARINRMDIECIFVPCQANKDAFINSGVHPPVYILPLGIDPDEFYPNPLKHCGIPYTFLTLGDRGLRKGWNEVWQAFYVAFGGKTTGNKDVRLIIKARVGDVPHTFKMMDNCEGKDERIVYLLDDVEDIRSVYKQADCLVLPSRYEGWGMPHREVAAMGIPVITQRYSGMDDGHLDEWAIALDNGSVQDDGMVADIGELAQAMHWCYDNRLEARQFAQNSARWLRENQTWQHMAKELISFVQNESELINALPVERRTLSLVV
jgi:glycosyltransferase involved in cell wall biosynthesis